ncbi:hypothetical protein [Helicovermis profundi]|uniref:Replication protein n=1 Tax=Helicovermis profundi TaxID=3065157 RepID=A0AAU9E7Z0_9FIRM|nr:hypothetical protein HLPR_11230 [Clostridia bacterium S502]
MSKKRIFILNDPYAPRLNSELAEEIGLNESILLLQIEYWISLSSNVKEGYVWTYQSASSIKKLFKFYSPSTINRILKNLIDKGLIIEGNYNKLKFDRTRWFRLNYANLSKLKSIKIEGFDYENNIVETNDEIANIGIKVLETSTNHFDLSTTQNDSCQNQNDSCQNQNDSCQNQNDSCQTQNDSTIPKTTTKSKDIKDSTKSKSHFESLKKIYNDDIYKITDMIIEKILLNHPKVKLPGKDRLSKEYIRWAGEIEKLNRIGAVNGTVGYSYNEIWNIAKWALRDSFWSINIQSTSKLRAKIITLEAQYKANLNKKNTSQNKSNINKSSNKFNNFTHGKDYTNEEIEKMLGVRT